MILRSGGLLLSPEDSEDKDGRVTGLLVIFPYINIFFYKFQRWFLKKS